MAAQLGPIMMPCRHCNVPPGEPCKRGGTLSGAPSREFHMKRLNDAAAASELLHEPTAELQQDRATG